MIIMSSGHVYDLIISPLINCQILEEAWAIFGTDENPASIPEFQELMILFRMMAALMLFEFILHSLMKL